MHAATPRIGIQGTIFSEHEVFGECCHFLIPFRYSCKKMPKINSFNYKIYNFYR